MAEDINAQPTITPVLDTTNLTNGMDEFDRSLKGRTVSLNTDRAAIIASNAVSGSSSGSSINQNGTDLSGIYERMNQLGERITQLGNDISNIKIVLDTGVVAGGVYPQTDARLGREQFYASRRN